jgi:hypothetical protein
MNNPQQDSDTYNCTLTGSVIDHNGEEVPITEDMIQQACEELEDTGLGKPDAGSKQH